ncbi:Rsp5p-dependent ubiquitination, sorting of cargo proteins at the multivesicular body [Ceratobasidium sp. 423]|nr:Rsp5p-dependent ubiquitination, sorting of cargo proteins at the multivesicular body [Ceratobasidium sp. 423]
MFVEAQEAMKTGAADAGPASIARGGDHNDALLVLLPLLIVLSCLLFLLLFFLVFVLLFRRRRSIALGDRNGPVDMSREDFSGADGGFEGLEQRWLDGVSDIEQRQYHRVKGHARQSFAYLSSGERSHNYPFTVASCGPPLIEGDVLGIGYRPRTGSAFFTRNGRRLEDAFTGLGRWNLFPTIGADGPCSLHVNLGQAGFVFIEANVKKWGLAPSVGTLAPPPAYGSERGSILLEAGGAIRRTDDGAEGTSFGSTGSPGYRTPTPNRRSTRHHPHAGSSSVPSHPSPLRSAQSPPTAPVASSLAPTVEEPETDTDAEDDERTPYVSPTDAEFHTPLRRLARRPAVAELDAESNADEQAEGIVVVSSPPVSPNPPTPRVTDIHLRPLNLSSGGNNVGLGTNVPALSPRALAALAPPGPPPPEYSPLDVNRYPNGVALDLPADVIAAALEGPSTRRH